MAGSRLAPTRTEEQIRETKSRRVIARGATAALLAGLATVAPCAPAASQAPAFLVKDINPVISPQASFPADLTDVDGTLYFTASTVATGRELWRSDGTEAGTVLVEDLRPRIGVSICVAGTVCLWPRLGKDKSKDKTRHSRLLDEVGVGCGGVQLAAGRARESEG